MGRVPDAAFIDDMCDEGRRLVDLTYNRGLEESLRDPARPMEQHLTYRIGNHLLTCEVCWNATYGSIDDG